jgi:hypothetical protein
LALWVRRHPTEPLAAELLNNPHPRIRLSTIDMPLHASLHACDEVVVTVSTVGVEAHLAGKVVTQVRGSILDHLSPFRSLGLADRELRIDQLSVLSSAPAEQKRLALEYGSAAERVVDVLQTVAQRTHDPRHDLRR